MAEIRVFSEIGRLKEVMLHRPGWEVENFTPEHFGEFLFDDIMYLEAAQREHDQFSEVLRKAGVKVHYLEDLVAQSMEHQPDAAKAMVEQYLLESGVFHPQMRQELLQWLYESKDMATLVRTLIAGVRSHEAPIGRQKSLSSLTSGEELFLVKPLPNILFTRDPFISIGHGVAISSMKHLIRRRETLLSDFLFRHHPNYAGKTPFWFERDNMNHLEGGDLLVINEEILFVGISERTDAYSVEQLAMRLFNDETSKVKKVVAFVIPKKRAFMHLDTVFTQIDHDKFTIHSEIEETLTLFVIEAGSTTDSVHITEEHKDLEHLLSGILDRRVLLLRCGDGDAIAGSREQWNDGANTLAISPGEVCVYERNHVTNRLLEDSGIKIHAILSSELSRGRGGPRCMSMPLVRENL
ncbi:arginine deiminase [Entomospira culicis]|uniref:Arginine deiminase n=1 Tax=Entomospira culicis TaxID=2719989 RepID=A0A968GII7_9SPIO|nr:arginine deiminase [Entomospira culicis]NIZ19403.1 arginine deiminase [Entomospira culicis]NIZ69692.1 arginine deiminase [Entomospira culicis]WDI36802.1 arginine deiminase [Entomospira culicis]WDI38431.1 arginine deiminase [Entomospira culicis]